MSASAQVFDELTYWDPLQRIRFAGGWNPGWRPPGEGRNIATDDPYWGIVLAKAREAYGDPNIGYNTDEKYQERFLVFGDGTRLPADGTIVYHDSRTGNDYVQRVDGTVSLNDGEPFAPAAYRRTGDGSYVPIDAGGVQVGPLEDGPPGLEHGFHDNNGVLTPKNTDGDYYTLGADGRREFFDRNGEPISEGRYNAGRGEGGADSSGSSGRPRVQYNDIGMLMPQYPAWAAAKDPDVPRQLTEALVRLYRLLGDGAPAEPADVRFPFRTSTGEDSGIENYGKVRGQFRAIENEFDDAAASFTSAVQSSAEDVPRRKNAFNDAVAEFNTTSDAITDGDWASLLSAEARLIDTARRNVAQASAAPTPKIADNPKVQPFSIAPAGPSPALAAEPGSDTQAVDRLLDRLAPAGAPLGGAGLPLGGMNPLGGLGGMNPLGGGGGGVNPLTSGAGSPVSPIGQGVEPLTELAGADGGSGEPAVRPLGDPSSAGVVPAPVGPAAAGPGPLGGGPGPQPSATRESAPAGEDETASSLVMLPDGDTVAAHDPVAAQAAQKALDEASPGGDAAHKAYSGLLDFPNDAMDLGAKVDPADMRPGDVLKFADKTMVAVAPGLIADPTEAGVTHTLAEVLNTHNEFQGIFRPTATDPTLTLPDPPPLQPNDEPTPPPATPVSDPEPVEPVPQPAPPSPFSA